MIDLLDIIVQQKDDDIAKFLGYFIWYGNLWLIYHLAGNVVRNTEFCQNISCNIPTLTFYISNGQKGQLC